MKRLPFCFALLLATLPSFADTYVATTTQTVSSATSSAPLNIETRWFFENTTVDGNSGVRLVKVEPGLYQSILPTIVVGGGSTLTVLEYSDGVFANSPYITEVTIPDTVLKLGDGVFSNCTALTTVSLGQNLRYVGKHPFVNTSVKAITLPDTLLSMDGNIAAGTPYGAVINVSDSSHFCYSEDGLLLLNKNKTRLYACATRAEGFVEVPGTVTEIMPEAFFGCFRLKCLNIPASVKRIGGNAFNVRGSWECFDAPEATPQLETVFYQGPDPDAIDVADDIYAGTPASLVSYAFDQRWKALPQQWKGRALEIKSGAFTTGVFEAEYLGISWKFRIVSDNGISYYAEIWNNGSAAIPVSTAQSVGTGDPFVFVPSSLYGFPVQKIGSGAFAGCNVCSTVYLPSTVSVIGDRAFSECSATIYLLGENSYSSTLTGLSIPDGVRSLGSRPFDGMSKVSSLWIPSSLKTLVGNPLAGCANVTEIEVSEANRYFVFEDPFLMSSDRTTLYACLPTATAITVPDTITDIADFAFENCDVLKTVTFLAPVTGSVPADTFKGLDKVSVRIDVNTEAGWNDLTNNAPWKALVDCGRFVTYGVLDPTGDSERSFTDATTGITWHYRVQGKYATLTGMDWAEDSDVSELTLPSRLGGCTVTNIGSYAFKDVFEIVKVTIPSRQYFGIGDYAFANCVCLEEIDLNQVKNLGKAPFFNTAIAKLELPSSLQSVDGNPLAGCLNLQAISFTDSNRSFTTDEDGDEDGSGLCLYNAEGTTLIGCCPCAEEITILSTLKKIMPDAFADCDWLKAVYAYCDAPTADDDVFCDTPEELTIHVDTCTYNWGDPEATQWKGAKLRNTGNPTGGSFWTDTYGIVWKYEISEGVATILSVAKANGAPVTALTVPEAVAERWPVKRIGANAFANLPSLVSVTIPATCIAIGDYAFSNCSALAAIEIPSGIRTIGKAPFAGTAITGLTIPNTATSISGNPLAGCVYATSITVADGNPFFTAANNLLFNKTKTVLRACAPSLSEITIPKSVGSISDDAFAGCIRLESITFEGGEPSAGDGILADTPTELIVYADAIMFDWGEPVPLTWRGREFVDTGTVYPDGGDFTDDNGVEWRCTIRGGTITLGDGISALPTTVSGKVAIPSALKIGELGTLPVIAIGNGAFSDCTDIESIEIPASVITIAGNAFNGCRSLGAFSVAADNPAYRSSSATGALYSKDGRTLVRVPPAFRFHTVTTAATETVSQGWTERIPVGSQTGTREPVGDLSETNSIKVYAFTPYDADRLFSGISAIADYAFTDCGTLPVGCLANGTVTVTDDEGHVTVTAGNSITIEVGTDSTNLVSETKTGISNSTAPDSNTAIRSYTLKRISVTYITTVPFPDIPSSVGYSRMAFYGSPWYDLTAEDVLPALGDDATPAEITRILTEADPTDDRLVANITDAVTYGDFRAWISTLSGADGNALSQREVLSSATAWTGFALDTSVLPDAEPEAVGFHSARLDGTETLRLLIAVDGIAIGSEAKAERIGTIIMIRGAYSDGVFSELNVVTEFGAPRRDGLLPVTVTPSISGQPSFLIDVDIRK